MHNIKQIGEVPVLTAAAAFSAGRKEVYKPLQQKERRKANR